MSKFYVRLICGKTQEKHYVKIEGKSIILYDNAKYATGTSDKSVLDKYISAINSLNPSEYNFLKKNIT